MPSPARHRRTPASITVHEISRRLDTEIAQRKRMVEILSRGFARPWQLPTLPNAKRATNA